MIMRKIILVLAVLALASPAMATVTITCEPGDAGAVTVSFVNDNPADGLILFDERSATLISTEPL